MPFRELSLQLRANKRKKQNKNEAYLSRRHATTKLLKWRREIRSDLAACFLQVRSQEFGESGEFRGSKELVKLQEYNSDIGNHLSLIMVCTGFFSTTQTQKREMMICTKHRAYLGQYWGNQTKTSSCRYPEHKGERKCGKTDQAFSVKLSREEMEVFGVLVPDGACKYCDIER